MNGRDRARQLLMVPAPQPGPGLLRQPVGTLPFPDEDWMLRALEVWLAHHGYDPDLSEELYQHLHNNWAQMWEIMRQSRPGNGAN